MPTTRPRHQITETPDIAEALDLAAQRWPDEPRSDLMRRLVLVGARSIAESAIERTLEIEVALGELAALSDLYPPGYLDRLRADWARAAP
jgi:hypothetical protein